MIRKKLIRCIIFLILESIFLKSRNNFLKQRVVYLRFLSWNFYRMKNRFNIKRKDMILLIAIAVLLFKPFENAFAQDEKTFRCVKTIKSNNNRIYSANFSQSFRKSEFFIGKISLEECLIGCYNAVLNQKKL